MKNMMVNGSFSHDMMMDVLAAMYPQLRPGVDFITGHYIDPSDGTRHSEPFIARWNAANVARPANKDVIAEFRAHEADYRARFARRYRNGCLAWSDAKMVAPADAPQAFSTNADAWKTYRQALRDITNQPGFPMDIDWPELPE